LDVQLSLRKRDDNIYRLLTPDDFKKVKDDFKTNGQDAALAFY
jgi:hypothetical protein